MPPKPTRPSVLPASSRPLRQRGARPLARARLRRVAPYAPRSSSIAGADHVFGHGAAHWRRSPESRRCRAPRRRRRSMLSSPTPSRPTTLSRGAAASSAASTCVRLRTISASALGELDAEIGAADRPARRRSARRSRARQRRDGRVVHEFADDDAHAARLTAARTAGRCSRTP